MSLSASTPEKGTASPWLVLLMLLLMQLLLVTASSTSTTPARVLLKRTRRANGRGHHLARLVMVEDMTAKASR